MIIIDVIGLSIMAVFLLFIFNKRNKNRSDYWLIITMAVVSIIFVMDIWIEYELNAINFLIFNTVGYYLLPSFITYGLLLIGEGHRIERLWIWYSIYTIAATVFVVIDVVTLYSYTQITLEDRLNDPPLTYHLFHKSYKIYLVIVVLWFLGRLRAYAQRIRDIYSSIESIRLTWLQNFSILYMVLTIISFPIFLAPQLGYLGDVSSALTLFNGAIVLSLFYASYHGIRQYTVADFAKEVSDMPNERSKYQTSSLTKVEMDRLFKEIQTLFEKEKIYHDPELKVQTIADRLKTTTHNISQTINLEAGKRFYDFVNEYRVTHFKTLLSNPENRKYTILALGLDSGFNSKASLNRIFKQHIGKTPREFLESVAA